MKVGEFLATLEQISKTMNIDIDQLLDVQLCIHNDIDDDSTIIEDVKVGYYESKFNDTENKVVLCPETKVKELSSTYRSQKVLN